MGWKDLLQKEDETLIAAWFGGREVRTHSRTFTVEGKLPVEFGWHPFSVNGSRLTLLKGEKAGEAFDKHDGPPGLKYHTVGYVVGDRLVKDDVASFDDPLKVLAASEPVWFVEDGLDRFVRVRAGRSFENGPLVYECMDMPLGPEDDVRAAFLDKKSSTSDISGVIPSLDAAFRMEVWRRDEADKQRAEAARIRREAEEKAALLERRKQIAEQLGDGAGRRAAAKLDFGEAAKAALAIGGAELLDHRKSVNKNEMVVTFRIANRRFECACTADTLRITDAGICLVDHRSGEKGDTYFTLESLPAVVMQAQREGKLFVFRHIQGETYGDDGHGGGNDDYDDYDE